MCASEEESRIVILDEPPRECAMGEDDIRETLKRHVNRTLHIGSDDFDQLIPVLKAHPTWGGEKMTSVTGMRVRLNRLNKSVQLQIKTRTPRWFTISWRKCAHRKKRQVRKDALTDEERNLTSAMRQSVRYQSKRWRRCTTERACSLCGSSQNLQVDHKSPTFHHIKQSFLSKQDRVPSVFGFQRSSCVPVFLKGDSYFKRKWQQFHHDHAEFRLLCRSCNCSRKP